MSFEQYLKEIQQRSPRERRTVTLVIATAVFIPLIVVLFFLGAFSLNSSGKGGSFFDLFRGEAAPAIDNVSTGVGTFVASTSQAVEEFRALASSTKALTGGTSTASMTEEGTTASTTGSTTSDVKEQDTATTMKGGI